MRPSKKIRLVVTALLLAPLACLAAAEPEPPGKPNIVIIMADDLGYGDLSCYGATKIHTPNIDRLASEGKKFTDAHSAAPVCSPSRYSLLLGRSSWRLNKTGNGYRLDRDRLTIAEVLQAEGYQTAAVGKWHLGYSKDWNKLPIEGPLEHGFDYHFGVPKNHNDDTRCFIENHDIVGRKEGEPFRIVKDKMFPEGLAEPRVEDQVDTVLTGKAIDFIRANADRPFFLYFTPCAPHTHITPAAKFRGTSQAGLLGDYVQELDSHVGDILKTLEELKIADNTLVIFTSDNGGSYKDFMGTAGTKLNLASEEGDILARYKTAKADAARMGHKTNGIYRGRKGFAEEGGHRVCFIARWPGKVPAGTTSDFTLCLTDLMATAADIIDVELPDDAAEDSISILPRLLEDQDAPRVPRTIYVQGDTKNDAMAICAGRWKLIAGKNKETATETQLYDLHADPSEMNNLARENPEIVQRMLAGYEKARDDGRTRP